MNRNDSTADKVLAETKFLRFVERNGWSFIERTTSNGVVCIIARTDDNQIILVEQFRPPVDCNVIELPAGLSGDVAGLENEPLEQAARRELLEETGYQAGQMTRLTDTASSPGLTNETVTFFLAEQLEKVAAGGGDASEDITVHEVPIDQIDDWLLSAQTASKLVDARVYAGLYFLRSAIE